MNKKQTIEMLNKQIDVWDKAYTTSRGKDAGLVVSVLQSILSTVMSGNGYADNELAGMTACYGSEALKLAVKQIEG